MMARDTRASRKAREDGSDPKAKGVAAAAAAASPDASVGGTPGLRSVTPSPTSTRKSERLGKLALETRPSKRKVDEFEKQNGSVSLRRPERSNNQSLSSSGSKKSDGSLDSFLLERKNVKEKSVSQLNMETKKVETSENRVVSNERDAKRMNSRAYRALFGLQNKADSAGRYDEMGTSVELSQQSNFGISDGASENLNNDEEPSQTRSPEENAEGEQSCINSERSSVESFEKLQETSRPQIEDRNKETSDCTPTPRAKTKEDLEHLNEKCTSTSRGSESITEVQPGCIDNLCSICKLSGNVMCCDGKGCQTRYHQACLSYHETFFTFGVWHCYSCVKKKILHGAHAVSKGIESVWKSKEEEVVAGNALKGKKQYFVKYKSLAHLHNQWLPDREVLNEAPYLIEKFNEMNQLTTWKGQWTVPRRLLQKRSVASLRQKDEPTCDIVEGHYEWLVKWLGLGYEHATWELENAFINSPEGERLVIEYEKFQERVKKAQCSNSSEKDYEDSFSVQKLSMEIGPLVKLPLELDNNHLEFVNNLRKCWDKGQSSIVIDYQGQMEKIVSFILSLMSHVSWPFLIISTRDALHSWDEEFFCLAPSVDVVFYHGDKDTRKGIRMVELCEKGGFVISQVIVTSSQVMSEDLDIFASTKWAAVFVDAGLISDMHGLLKQIKVLSPHMMLLLVNEKLKDEMKEHVQSVFGYQIDIISCNGQEINSNPRIPIPKERFSKNIPQSCKLDSKFLEYWVPAAMSDIQLEQYCANLLSNSLSLWSASKKDPVGSLHHILGDARKCCDHPYLLDSSPQTSLAKEGRESEILNVGIKASGKLLLLDMMLSEIKSRSLRVLVLFQTSISPGKISIGDILDDFVRQRYGNDSYERCDGIIDPTKRQAAVQKFNQCDGRFVFLLDTRACGPAIKLSSVDCVIFFGSNWSPMNDIRNLQRLTIDSKSERIKVFRLYSTLTLEEKALILAREDNNVDCKVQNLNCAACHVLLMWGALVLFEKLVEFHSRSSLVSNEDLLFEQLRPENIIKEFVAILDQNGKDDKPSNYSVIVEVQAREVYSTNAHLPGELKSRPIDDVEPHLFWKKLLDIKQPPWRYPSSFGAERKRKRVPCLHNDPQIFDDGGLKKQKKVAANKTRPPFLGPPSVQGNMTGSSRLSALDLSASLAMSSRPGLSDNSPEVQEGRTDGVTERVNLSETQESLHSRLKLEIATLSEVLKLPDNVKAMVESFLDYVMNNHHVTREPATILQAFQLSLCWTAASILKYKLDHKESVSLARQHLKFGCKKEDVEYVYSMLRCLKSVFLHRTGRLEVAVTPLTPHISSNELGQEALNARSLHPSWANIIEHTVTAPLLGLAQKDFSKSIQDIEKKCTKQMTKLLEKQQKEKEAIQCSYNDEKTLLENKKKTERAVIRCHRKGAMEVNQLKLLEDKYAEKFDNLKSQIETRLKHLEGRHAAAREQLLERKSHLIEGLKSWAQVELVNKPLEKDPENAISQMSCSMNQISEGPSLQDGQESLKDINEGCTSSSGNVVPVQVDDDTDSRDQYRLLAVPSGNPSEISQPNANICITNPEFHFPFYSLQNENSMLGEPEAHQCEQQDINHNSDFSAETSEVTPQIRGAPLKVGGSTSMAVMGDDLSRENLGVSLVSSTGRTGQANDITLEVLEIPSILADVADVIIDDIVGRENHGDAVSQLHCDSRHDEPANMVQSQVPKVPSTVPEIATDVIVEDSGGRDNSRDNSGDAVVQLHCDSRCDAWADVVPSQVTEVPSTLMEIATDVIVDVNAGRGNNGDAVVVQVHRSSRCDEPADVVPSQVPETSNVIEEGEVNVRSVGELSAISSEGVRVSNQSDELPSDCNQNKGLPQANSPPLLPTVASAEENCMPSSLALHEECDQPAQEDHYLDTSHLPVEVIETPVESSHQSVSEFVSSYSVQQPGGTTANQSDCQVPGTRTGLNAEIGNPPIQTASAVRMPATLSLDPLQKELEIIKKEKEETIRNLENMKLQLKSDCEKEIQEAVAEIRRKYEVKLQETESTFILKKNELDANHLKVLKSKMVAEAFKSKCMDIKVCASNSSSTQQGMASNFMHLASSQPPSVRPSTNLSPADCGSIRTIMINGHQASNVQSNISPREIAGPSLSPSPSRAAEPPCISPSPIIGNLQVSRQISAPGHLQHFRHVASVSTASPSMSGGMPNQQVLGSVIGTPMLPPLPPRPSLQTRPYGPQIMFNRLHRSDGDFSPSNSSPNARESIALENQTNSSRLPPSNLPSTTQLNSNFEALQLNADTALLNPPHDVVCLSDDE